LQNKTTPTDSSCHYVIKELAEAARECEINEQTTEVMSKK